LDQSKLKICVHCKDIKSLEGFYRDRKSADGRASWCKWCVRANERAYRRSPRGKKTRREFLKTPVGQRCRRRAGRVYGARYPEKISAHRVVRALLEAGVLIHEKCIVCGKVHNEEKNNLIFHHSDYFEPMCVFDLCNACHQKVHNESIKLSRDKRAVLHMKVQKSN